MNSEEEEDDGDDAVVLDDSVVCGTAVEEDKEFIIVRLNPRRLNNRGLQVVGVHHTNASYLESS